METMGECVNSSKLQGNCLITDIHARMRLFSNSTTSPNSMEHRFWCGFQSTERKNMHRAERSLRALALEIFLITSSTSWLGGASFTLLSPEVETTCQDAGR